MRKLFLLTATLLIAGFGYAQKFQPNWQSLNTRKMPPWFHQAKFGIFIHWGLYSVPAYAPVLPNSGYNYAEWYWRRIRRDHTGGPEQNEASRQMFTDFHNKNYGKDFKYEQFEPMFKAELYDPQQWEKYLKKLVPNMWYLLPNTTKGIASGIALKQTAIGGVPGTLLPARQNVTY